MAENIDRIQVKKVAKLARLELTDAEIDEFTGQLADTQNVEPLAHSLPVSNVFREDVVKESLGTEKVLANAPQRDEMFFIVPKILDESGGA